MTGSPRLVLGLSQRAVNTASAIRSLASLVFLLLHLLLLLFSFSSDDAICAHSGIYTVYLTYTRKHDRGGEEDEGGLQCRCPPIRGQMCRDELSPVRQDGTTAGKRVYERETQGVSR